ncbi:hypothetical protein N7540_009336 [Penicillium herquei]|nr:hypothetical protein N7540_009336 [Penicillium herquei]
MPTRREVEVVAKPGIFPNSSGGMCSRINSTLRARNQQSEQSIRKMQKQFTKPTSIQSSTSLGSNALSVQEGEVEGIAENHGQFERKHQQFSRNGSSY